MEATEYDRLADACLQRVEDWLEGFDPDELDYATSDGVVTLEFADRMRFVLNRQAAAHQMWFAAVDRAWHYEWDAGATSWKCDKDGHELYARIAEVVGEKLGRSVDAI